ncbi:MAG TPA: ATP-dependent RNA helicase HrpA [Opitutus sp.]|nr:ATP-dependent RNA helicase HrpA [Opitutus sp.]
MRPPPASDFPFRLEFPPELPISARAQEITEAIQAHPVVILAGETGSGKTTQIPKMCLAAGRGTAGRIACTQPRRVAALSISRRVAEELGVTWGHEVGCKIRFTDQTTPRTVIKFLTDGMLLAEVQGDPLLREYDTVILDEAHERSLNIDFLLGHLRALRYRRPELKIIVTSATIDTAAFSAAFDDAPVIQVEGRTFPVEVIYTPLDELGSDLAEGDERESKSEALHYIDGTVAAIERIVADSPTGDILAFLPSERDIREIRDLLEGRRLRDCELVPLFGRLSNAEQQRVFAATPHRKIVLATNIAETSLTIPGVHFVVDAGLARISRYSPQARTRRLPIEPIAQSSADQRKGRAGRIAHGVCIRLYSEKDYLERPRFTQPEIQRANLADVILRLKAYGLGDIERFPFITMPAAKSIRAGYALLEELGAIDHPAATTPDSPGTAQLTPIGRELARLPVDPTVGRMILQARAERALREVLVIAAGLSIQDPRERPLDRQQLADAAHRRFAHPDSDFLTLLNVWDAYHDQFENLSQSRLRRFCRDHFLSYTRMREWRDIHAQLLDVLREREDFRLTSVHDATDTARPSPTASGLPFGSPAYRAIHRSILAGLLGNIARYDEERQNYHATHDRRVTLFPGSVLFQRDASRKKPAADRAAPAARESRRRTPRWILASEIIETTRLFARTCARLDLVWVLDLAAHVLAVSHSEPLWDADAGRVTVKRRTRLYGLELETRAVSYGRVNPAHATEIFIREALVNDAVTFPLDFLAHNRRIRANVAAILTRTRDAGYLNLDESVYRFYAARLLPAAGSHKAPLETQGPVSSVPELIDLVRQRRAAEPRFLFMEPADLRDPDELAHDTAAFPPSLPLENRALPLNYAYKPGQSDDGVTLDVPLREASTLTPAALDWAVPAHVEPKVEHYLRALPKELRRGFIPLADNARSLAAQIAGRDRLTGRRETIAEALAAQIAERFRVAIDPALWTAKPPPEHLRVRIRVLDDEGRELAASRELAEIRTAAHAVLSGRQPRPGQDSAAFASKSRDEPDLFQRARAIHERPPATSWVFGDIPARVLVTESSGVPLFAFPGLRVEREGVALRLFPQPEEAQASTARGLSALLEHGLSRDLGWLERDLRALRQLGTLSATLAPPEALQGDAFDALRRWLTVPTRVASSSPSTKKENAAATTRLTAAAFNAALESSRADVRGLVPRLVDLLREILALRQEILVHPQPYPGLDRDLASLLPPDFLRVTPFPQLAHFPRYLRAMKLRADRWRQHPKKDADRAATLAPYLAAAAKSPASPGATAFRWLVEEFRVSLFAQELGTAEPVSAPKLDRALTALAATRTSGPLPVDPPRPIVATPIAEKKSPPLKNLGALDKLFPR